jgi:hypothetical protein
MVCGTHMRPQAEFTIGVRSHRLEGEVLSGTKTAGLLPTPEIVHPIPPYAAFR